MAHLVRPQAAVNRLCHAHTVVSATNASRRPRIGLAPPAQIVGGRFAQREVRHACRMACERDDCSLADVAPVARSSCAALIRSSSSAAEAIRYSFKPITCAKSTTRAARASHKSASERDCMRGSSQNHPARLLSGGASEARKARA
eukprot:4834412-Pleurochrysis_carterae.AAC.1